MKRYALLLLALVLLAGGLIGFVALRPVEPATVPPPVSRPAQGEPVAMKPIVAPPPVAPGDVGAIETGTGAQPAEALPPLIEDEARAINRIERLATTFDEAHVAELARYLDHASAKVRIAARAGLLLLDDASAVPYLRSAAETAENRSGGAVEAAALRDAADILAAPRSATEVKMAKRPLIENGGDRMQRAVSTPHALQQ